MMDKNKETYTKSNIVRHYSQLQMLQPAEQTILDFFQDRLSTIKMLDIGIGGGRTTQHFSPLVQDYTLIDYSNEMIAACQQRFPESSQSRSLQVVDARRMQQFSDNSFDFILFSFNGIDYVSHSDRLQILKEIHRIGKVGGHFFFSSHNLQAMAREFVWRTHISLNLLKTYVNLMLLALLRLFNASITRAQLQNADHLMVRDESHNFRLQTYYIRPAAQLQQLASHFEDIKVYSWNSGLQISRSSDLSMNFDMWLYYLCVIA
jgi:ubiquinone/menaquinone biosynthesis C-methylase UbiE